MQGAAKNQDKDKNRTRGHHIVRTKFMPDDISDGPVDQQGKSRRVLSGDSSMVAIDQGDGVTALRPSRLGVWPRQRYRPISSSRRPPRQPTARRYRRTRRHPPRSSRGASPEQSRHPAADVKPLIDKIGIRILDLYRTLDQ